MTPSETLSTCILPAQADTTVSTGSPVRVCAIDLGTNSFHAVIFDAFPNGTFKVVAKLKELVRLGAGSLRNRHLSEEAMDRAVAALRRIRILADGWRATEYMAFATSATREADNGGDLIRRARSETGINIRTIEGELEAELIYRGVRRSVQLTEPSLIVDIGGGSTEFIVGDHEQIFLATSLKLGAARIQEEFNLDSELGRVRVRALRRVFRSQLSAVYSEVEKRGVRRLVGSSGTIENLGQAHVSSTGSARPLFDADHDARAFRKSVKRVLYSSSAERRRMKGIDPKRIDQITAGAALLDTLLKDLPIESVAVSAEALREGMMLHFIEQNYERLEHLAPYDDLRRRSVHELGYRCQWDYVHGRHVAALSLHLFDGTSSLHQLDTLDRELLEYASLLHDIGYHISRRGHHKHSAYLIENADLVGFPPEEVTLMAQVVRYHRRSLPVAKHTSFQELPEKLRARIQKLAALLRLAEGLDKSHFRNVVRLRTVLTKRRFRIGIVTRSDPEIDVWGARQSVDLFEAVYGLAVEIFGEPINLAEEEGWKRLDERPGSPP